MKKKKPEKSAADWIPKCRVCGHKHNGSCLDCEICMADAGQPIKGDEPIDDEREAALPAGFGGVGIGDPDAIEDRLEALEARLTELEDKMIPLIMRDDKRREYQKNLMRQRRAK